MDVLNRDKRLLLVDGNSIINRSFFAMAGRSNLTAPDGTPTGALNTYLNTLYKFMDEVKPTHVCTLFDVRAKTFRHEMYDGYKAKRKGMPDDLAVQMPLLKEVLDAMNLSRYELPGFEADDLIGTLAQMGEKAGFAVHILSGDKDDFQLIDQNTVVLMPSTKAGKTTTEIYDEAALLERYGTTPKEFITLKAIMGDPSDNIPGVKGIGEKGAIDLVQKYKTLDGIYLHLDELSPGLQKKLMDNKEMAYLSYDLSAIHCDAPATITLDDLKVESADQEALAGLFYRLGLRSQIKKWDLETVSVHTSPGSSVSLVEESNGQGNFALSDILPSIHQDKSLEEFLSDFKAIRQKEAADFCLSIDIPMITALKLDPESLRLLVCLSADALYAFPLSMAYEVMAAITSQGFGQDNYSHLVVGHSIKNRFRLLPESLPLASCFDVEIAGYILNQIAGGAPSFEMLYEHALGEEYPRFAQSLSEETPTKAMTQNTLEDLLTLNQTTGEDLESIETQEEATATQQALQDSAWRALLCRRIYICQRKQVADLGLEELVYEIEMPLVLHLDQMERAGVLVDSRALTELHMNFTAELARLSGDIYAKSGTEFNILSPKQLGQVLFETLGLPSGRKNSSGSYSTDSDELTRLLDAHPVIQDILDYRQISKLDSTFVQGLQKVIDPVDHRVHSNFSQVMTNTGRLSSSEPNLQNIPIRSKLGSQIRKAFIVPEGYLLLDADYSQIELRLLAHLSQDENMIQAFLNNEDIHTTTAARIFNVPRDQVDSSMRSAAKTVNFSIVYGISDFGLSQDLGISYKEAHHYIDHYYAQYPKIRGYLDSLKKMGYDMGYVETMYGRRRIVKELTSPNRNLRSFGERAAMNTPVQGTAADIIKIAMNRVSQTLSQEKLDARLILQVHDELLVECREDEVPLATKLLKEAMEGAAKLLVPLVAEVNVGKSWYECKV